MVTRYREAILNAEINDLIEEAKVSHTQISYLDKEKLDLQVRFDVLQNQEKQMISETPKRFYNKRSVEDIREALAENEVNIEIYLTKKKSIENELIRLTDKERERHFNYFEFERQNYHVSSKKE